MMFYLEMNTFNTSTLYEAKHISKYPFSLKECVVRVFLMNTDCLIKLMWRAPVGNRVARGTYIAVLGLLGFYVHL